MWTRTWDLTVGHYTCAMLIKWARIHFQNKNLKKIPILLTTIGTGGIGQWYSVCFSLWKALCIISIIKIIIVILIKTNDVIHKRWTLTFEVLVNKTTCMPASARLKIKRIFWKHHLPPERSFQNSTRKGVNYSFHWSHNTEVHFKVF